MIIRRNPDEKYAKEIIQKLKNNDGYCPCNLVKTPDTKCKCKEFRDMIKRGETGMCHCGLFVIEDEQTLENKGTGDKNGKN